VLDDTALFDDSVRLLTNWAAPSQEQAELRNRTLRLLGSGPKALRREHLAGHLTASVVIISADRSAVLLCLHGRMNKWVQVGGHCEDTDRGLAAAALREATEESGIVGLTIDPMPIDVDIHPVTCSAGQTEHFDVRFLVTAPPDAQEKVSHESHELGWFAPDKLPEPLASATGRVVDAALARLNGRHSNS
jgi:8-oxo-dGTP pyrophosphatase MutT (NUDIX family)